MVTCCVTNEECLRSGLQECLTSLHFIAAAEGLSFFSSKYLIPWTGWAGKASRSSTLFFLQNTPKRLLHKSHQLLRNSIFGSQKLLCKILTVNSSLRYQYNTTWSMGGACVRVCACMGVCVVVLKPPSLFYQYQYWYCTRQHAASRKIILLLISSVLSC